MGSSLSKIQDRINTERNRKEMGVFREMKSSLIEKIESVDPKYHNSSQDASDLKWLHENWDKVMANKNLINLISNWKDD